MRISFLIVTYNSARTIKDCLKSLDLYKDKYEVIIVDNCSEDDTVSIVRSSFPGIKQIENDKNVGFGAGINLAAKNAIGDYFFILNPDSVLIEHCADTLMEYMNENPDCGIAGPAIINENNAITKSAFKFTTLHLSIMMALGKKNANNCKAGFSRRVDWVNGAAILVRNSDFMEIGGFDENFFLYSEEEDLAFRMLESSKAAHYYPNAEVKHIGSVSTDSQSMISRASADWSRHFFLRKHHGWIASLISKVFWIPALCIRAMVKKITGNKKDEIKSYMTSVKALMIPGYYQNKVRPPR